MKTVREDPTVRVRDKQAVWKLLSEISRTTPDLKIFFFLRGMLQGRIQGGVFGVWRPPPPKHIREAKGMMCCYKNT